MKMLRPAFLSTLILALFGGIYLNGCMVDGDSEVDRQTTLSARWVSGDSIFVFSIHDEEPFEGMPNGRISVIRLFEAKVNHALQAYEVAEVYDLSGAWGCSDLRVTDSVIFLSFYRYPEEAGADQEGCPNTRHGSQIFAGLRATAFGERLSMTTDTTSLRPQLSQLDFTQRATFDSGFKLQGNLYKNRDICLEGGRCLGDLVRIWDEKP
jgi:hypothetical protein